MPANHRKILMVSSPRWNLLAIFPISLRKHFVYGVRHYVMTLAHSWSQTAISPLIDVARISTNLQVDGMRWRVITFFLIRKNVGRKMRHKNRDSPCLFVMVKTFLEFSSSKLPAMLFFAYIAPNLVWISLLSKIPRTPDYLSCFFVAFCCIKLYTIYITWVVKC